MQHACGQGKSTCGMSREMNRKKGVKLSDVQVKKSRTQLAQVASQRKGEKSHKTVT